VGVVGLGGGWCPRHAGRYKRLGRPNFAGRQWGGDFRARKTVALHRRSSAEVGWAGVRGLLGGEWAGEIYGNTRCCRSRSLVATRGGASIGRWFRRPSLRVSRIFVAFSTSFSYVSMPHPSLPTWGRRTRQCCAHAGQTSTLTWTSGCGSATNTRCASFRRVVEGSRGEGRLIVVRSVAVERPAPNRRLGIVEDHLRAGWKVAKPLLVGDGLGGGFDVPAVSFGSGHLAEGGCR
jgi:hypothetical protein